MQRDGLNNVVTVLKTGDSKQAMSLCKAYLEQWPDSVPAIILYSKILQKRGRFDEMLSCISEALTIESVAQELSVHLRLIECLLYNNQIATAKQQLKQLESKHSDPAVQAQLAEFYLHCSDHVSASRCYGMAATSAPENTEYVFNLASAHVSLGDLDEAEVLLEKVISLRPDDYDAYYNRATLKKMTASTNHIAELESLRKSATNNQAQIALNYALGKEYEDLQDYDQAFNAWQRGAKVRRQQMAYKVTNDLNAMQLIKKSYSDKTVSPATTERKQDYEQNPIFILGLPRSGTTLVDRMLSSHSDVASLGEINTLAFSVIKAVGDHSDKAELIARSVACDKNALADNYLQGIASYETAGRYLIDKTPLNFLYLGLIAESMPEAKIIHLRRHPLESVIAMYKTLFRMGYPFSYDLKDLCDYIAGYHSLMSFWQSVFPGRILDVNYEDLVQEPEAELTKLLTFCNLPWQDDCLNFHANQAPTATASAAQVRQPIYTSSMNKRQYFDDQLKPWRDYLVSIGVTVAD